MSYKTFGHVPAMSNLAKLGKLLTVLAAVGMVLLGATTATGFDPYKCSTNYCGPKLEAYKRTLPNPIPNRPIPGVNFNTACYEHDKCYGMCSSNCSSKASAARTGSTPSEAIRLTTSTLAASSAAAESHRVPSRSKQMLSMGT